MPTPLRVQVCAGACDDSLPGALGTDPPPTSHSRSEAAAAAEAAVTMATLFADPERRSPLSSVTNGNLKATMEDGMLVFARVDDGKVLLRQTHGTVPAAG